MPALTVVILQYSQVIKISYMSKMKNDIVGVIKSVLFGSRILGSVLSHCSNFINRSFR